MGSEVMAIEVNFDGLIGPTHNYSGLSLGNIASANHAQQRSYPKAAALQGLGKMRQLMSLGYTQGILLPQIRPDLKVLRAMGFSGSGFTGSAEWIADLTKTSKLKTSFSTELTDTSTVAFSADSPENSSVDNLEVNTDVVRNSLFHLTYVRDDASLNSRYWVESRKVRYSGSLLTRET